MQQRLWCMLLSAIDWTTATAYWLVSAANCYKGSKSSRMVLLVFHRSQKIRAYDAHLTRSSLAAGSTADHVQDSSLVYKCLHDRAAQYLQTYCEPTSTVASWRLRSTHCCRLTVPCTRANYRDRSFAVQGPRVWNSLPAALRAPDITLTTFRNKLKTFLFNM